MWWHFILLLASVKVDHLHCVQWQTFEGIDGHAEETRVSVNVPVDVSLSQIVVNGGVVQISQIGHVLTFFIFGGILLQNLISFNN